MVAIISFIIFLFVTYLLSREDFVFLRRSVTTEQLFDIAFLSSLSGVLFSRIVYAALHPSIGFLNPLVFFLIPYFPGLALSGLILGSFLAVLGLTNRKKFPTARILDVFSLSFFYSFAFYFVCEAAFQLVAHQFFIGGLFLGIGLLSFMLSILMTRLFASSSWKDGSIVLWVLSFISLLTLVEKALVLIMSKKFSFDIEAVIFLVLCLIVVIIALQRQFMVGRGNVR